VVFMQFCRWNFPTLHETQPAERTSSAAVTTRLSISVQEPNFLKVITVNKAVVSRTLYFSANWFCASTNICRQLPFKLFENLLLLSAIGKEVKPRSSVRVPYQMSLEAREHMAISFLRTDAFIARVKHMTITTKFKKNACVVGPADLSVGPGEVYCVKDMKSRIDQFVDKVHYFHSAAERKCLEVVTKKFGTFMALQPYSGL
jgi:hypothetical protein